MNQKKKIDLDENFYVAGASGMVGSAVVRTLKKNGYGKKNNGGNILIPSRQELDLLNAEKVDHWIKSHKPTVVIIAAAKVGGIFANSNQPYDFLLENLKIQNNLIESSFKNNIKRLLFLGSSCIYPKFAKQPIKEEYLLSSELESTNEWYALAKIAGIKLCQSLRVQYNFDAISLMPTNLYGPNDNYHPLNSHVVASLIRKFIEAKKNSYNTVECWGSGNPFREFMHVDDLGEAILFALEHWSPCDKHAPKDSKGNPLTYLNVGTGKDITIKDLSIMIARATGFKGKIEWDLSKPDGTPKKLLDIGNLKNLGWQSNISLEEGIKKTIQDLEHF